LPFTKHALKLLLVGMKNTICVLLVAAVALFTCGSFVVLTPKQIEEMNREAREWSQTVQSRYDFATLNSFLKKTVSEKKCWQDVDLTKPTIGEKWTETRFDHLGSVYMSMTSGDWSFETPNPKKNEFTLSFSSQNGDRVLVLKCVRKSKDSFELVEITSEYPRIYMCQTDEENYPHIFLLGFA